MDGLDQNLLLLFAVTAVAFYVGRMSTGSDADRERYKQYDRDMTQQNLSRLSSDARREVEGFVSQGKIIDAVKVVRAQLSLGLKEAKMVVDALTAEQS